jgi:choice-of-anchor A domain-containing protein
MRLGAVVALLSALLAAVVALTPTGAPAALAATTSCASLGSAANYGIFSNGSVDYSAASGTSVSGGIAAAGDVTLGSITVGANSAGQAVLTGGSFTGVGGTVNGNVTYGDSFSTTNFTVNGSHTHASPSFSFASAFTSLAQISSELDALPQTSGATVAVQQGSNALVLTTTSSGTTVLHVTAAQLAGAAGIIISAPASASIIIDIDGTGTVSTSMQYMSIGGVQPSNVVWNLPVATGLEVNSGVFWDGTILAPSALIDAGGGKPQISGQLIAGSIGAGEWVVYGAQTKVCLPVQTPGGGSSGGGGTPPPGAIVPMVQCVTPNTDGTFVAFFGYTNSGSAVTIPIGSNNTIAPTDLGGREPTSFSSGTVSDAFSVTVPKGQVVEWVISGIPAVASSGSPNCQNSDLSADPFGLSLVFVVVIAGLVGVFVVRRTARGPLRT